MAEADNGALEILFEYDDVDSAVNCRNTIGWTPLHFAVCFGKTNATKLLLDHGASMILTTTYGGRSAAALARHTGRMGILELIIEEVLPVDVPVLVLLLPHQTRKWAPT